MSRWFFTYPNLMYAGKFFSPSEWKNDDVWIPWYGETIRPSYFAYVHSFLAHMNCIFLYTYATLRYILHVTIAKKNVKSC